MQYSLLKGHFTHVKLFFKITEIETLINITYNALPDVFSQQMFLCFIINSFNDKTIIAMGAAILPNLLRFSMLRKPDVTSVVSKCRRRFVEDFLL